MDSIKTKTKTYTMLGRKAIAQVVIIPEGGSFRVYVAWEWEEQAKRGIFAIMKSTRLHNDVNCEVINYVADYGNDITPSHEARKLFSNLL